MLLKDSYKKILNDIFSHYDFPFEVWAYGSRVNGNAHEGSDLDLVIITPERKRIPIQILMEIKENIRESNIPILVDIFDWASLPSTFHENIEAKHEVLYTSVCNCLNENKKPYEVKGEMKKKN